MTRLTLIERNLRIGTGLILAVYIVVHLANHSLGLISLEAMEAMRRSVTPFWRSPIGGLLIYGSLLTHFALALLSLYRRTTLRMPRWELAQLLLGLSIVPLLAGHIAMTWGARVLMGYDLNYNYALNLMLSDNWSLARQGLLLIVAWGHMAVGLHFFLRLFRSYGKWRIYLSLAALLIPLLVALSMLRIGTDLQVWHAETAAIVDRDRTEYILPDQLAMEIEAYPAEKNPVDRLHEAILIAFGSLLALTLMARALRDRARKSRSSIVVRHINGQEMRAIPGQTLLEIIRSHSIPHASLCGGRGRCATCRVRVGRGLRSLAPPSTLERKALKRIEAAPNVRLACQTRPTAPLDITPLMSADLDVDSEWREGGVSGEEREIVALFVDLRGSSRLSERHLSYDVLFILNRFFLEMSAALRESHGHYAQFEGDGLLALYGLERGLELGCKDALHGAITMQRRLDQLNDRLENELREPLRIGIGLHCGVAIVGTMGPPGAPNYSAIGDCVNAAARLQFESKEYQCVLIVSAEVLEHSDIEPGRIPRQQIALGGKQKSVLAYLVKNPLDLTVGG